MKEEILLEEPHIVIYFDQENNWLYIEWKGDQSLKTVMDGCLKMLSIVKERKITKVLNNNQEVTSSWSDAANWGGKVWFPDMKAAGVNYFAWVYSPFVFSRLSTDLSIAYSEVSPYIKTFDDVARAAEWLKNQ